MPLARSARARAHPRVSRERTPSPRRPGLSAQALGPARAVPARGRRAARAPAPRLAPGDHRARGRVRRRGAHPARDGGHAGRRALRLRRRAGQALRGGRRGDAAPDPLGGRLHARARHHPPRPQAREPAAQAQGAAQRPLRARDERRERRRADRQDHRLRPLEDVRRRRRRRGRAADQPRRAEGGLVPRHARIPCARAAQAPRVRSRAASRQRERRRARLPTRADSETRLVRARSRARARARARSLAGTTAASTCGRSA